MATRLLGDGGCVDPLLRLHTRRETLHVVVLEIAQVSEEKFSLVRIKKRLKLAVSV